jgi:hypothetical protein
VGNNVVENVKREQAMGHTGMPIGVLMAELSANI